MLKNTATSYGLISRLFHWIIGLMLVGLIIVGFTMGDMAPSPEKIQLYTAHKSMGVIMLGLISLRFMWRLMNKRVGYDDNVPRLQQITAHLLHYSLYVLMFIMPISGISMNYFAGQAVDVFGLFSIPGAAQKTTAIAKTAHFLHELCAPILVTAISLHVAAALYHHFIKKDNILRRIIWEN